MNEDFLHYLWKHKRFDFSCLKTTNRQEIVIQKVGIHNIENSGPDFFNALITIQDQKWAGNVEIHGKSSDWYAHHHENDRSYDNVILHVVWEDDVEIFRKDNSIIPTLQLKDYVPEELLIRYRKLFENDNGKRITCEKLLPGVSDFVMANWQERLYLERLEQKSLLILELLKESANDWETVLFKLLAKNFGLKANGEAFLSLANSLDFSIIRKCNGDLHQLESLFFGQTGLLEQKEEIAYAKKLQEEYVFLKNKFKLSATGVLPVQFFRLRPPNFPTIRLAQFASLYTKNKRLFNDIIQTKELNNFYNLFDVTPSEFWQNHYTFEKTSRSRKKTLTTSFIDLIMINTIIPLKFVYARSVGKNAEEEIFELISQLPYEKNNIVDGFLSLNVSIENALHSQAMIQLRNKYCDQKACLKCAIGNYLLNQDQSLG